MRSISKAAQRLSDQPVFHILAKASELERRGQNILHFELGDPDFSIPRAIVEAANRSLIRGGGRITLTHGIG